MLLLGTISAITRGAYASTKLVQGTQRLTRKKKAECGTVSGCVAHYYYKTPVCEPCKQARSEYWKKFKSNNPDYKKDYHKANPEQTRQDARRRRARIRGVESQPYTEAKVLDLYGFSCHLCGELVDLDAPRMQGKDGWEKGLHLDHLIPISAGGSNTIDNIRPAHALCNLQKGIRWSTQEKK